MDQEFIAQKRAERTDLLEGKELLRKEFICKIGEVNEEERIIPFILSTDTVDRHGDMLNQDGWELDTYKANPVVLWAHNSRALPLGKNLNVRVEDGQLKADTRFLAADETGDAHFDFVESVYRMIQHGYLNAKSVGFRPLTWAWNEERGAWAIDFETMELLEDSVVPVPANPEALIDAKSKGINTAPIAKWASEILDTLPLEHEVKRSVYEQAYKHGIEHPSYFKGVDVEPSSSQGGAIALELDTSGALKALEEVKAALEEVEEIAQRVLSEKVEALDEPCVETPTDEAPESVDPTEESTHKKSTEEAPSAAPTNPEELPVVRLVQ
jgi:HK97 family phage prohead protease